MSIVKIESFETNLFLIVRRMRTALGFETKSKVIVLF